MSLIVLSSCMLVRNSTEAVYEFPTWLLTFPLIVESNHWSLQLTLNCGFNRHSSGFLPITDTHVNAQKNIWFSEFGPCTISYLKKHHSCYAFVKFLAPWLMPLRASWGATQWTPIKVTLAAYFHSSVAPGVERELNDVFIHWGDSSKSQ